MLLCVCACACACERERETEISVGVRGRRRRRERERERVDLWIGATPEDCGMRKQTPAKIDRSEVQEGRKEIEYGGDDGEKRRGSLSLSLSLWLCVYL